MFFLCAGQEVTAQYQCIYLAPDVVVLLLEVLEFCCKDPKALAQIAERNGVLICCSQLHHSARRLKASRSTQVRLRCFLHALKRHMYVHVSENNLNACVARFVYVFVGPP